MLRVLKQQAFTKSSQHNFYTPHKIPDIDTGGAAGIDTDEESFGDLSDLDLDDILSDFDI